MDSALRGRQLEHAIARAAVAYRQQGRCMLSKIPTPMITSRDGYLIPSGAAGPDFLGCLEGGRLLAVEAKETRGAAFPLDHMPESQRTALARYAALGADCRLIVSFEDIGEAFGIAWDLVEGFLRSPWRASLSLAWCRAFGLLLPERESASARRMVLFLEGARHAAAEAGRHEAAADAERCRARLAARERAAPQEDELALAAPPVPAPQLSPQERIARIASACAEGIERQLRGRRKARWQR
jgi:recombination protein U